MKEIRHRPIRSYVLRTGRFTPGQQKAFERWWPEFGVDFESATPLDPAALFGNHNPVWLEIGFGNGESLAQMAQNFPERNFLGIEVHTPGVGHLLLRLGEQGITNVRIMHHDAMEILEQSLAEASLEGVQLFFPDPWHKKKHHKRRIVRPDFVTTMGRLIAPGGIFHAATDWEDYAEQIMTLFSAREDLFDNLAGAGNYSPRPDTRPITKFEQRGQRLGHGVWDLLFRRKA
ncbi:tRNA (guanosine(46)-N7)-methyltransferase TrmB [Thiolapillus brandeum]|uniref:tRNA (guanine-N(7)-)-methyltransferase n=1 Tax=Thiolapillus brandeum TaxID=1076588 RepID=A0A7U6GGX0_9GAMM|nr:tRNA (guanine-N7-)-methyltransferase [Thiolapillus brandeum]